MDTWTDPASPAWAGGLLAEVDSAFAVVGADTPGWPDPHGGEAPADEEYSRCLDPGKYRILDRRIEAWAQVLRDRGIAEARDLPLGGPQWQGASSPPDEFHRFQRIVPTEPDGLVLHFAHTIVDGAPFGLVVGLGSPDDAAAPPVLVGRLPMCGCDACDDGSEALLKELDGCFVTTAQGGVVHVSEGERSITRTADGWRASGDADEGWLDAAAPHPPGRVGWWGKPWL
ncbi:MAG TPA: DUF6226 family protein [Nocardioides sp.]|uniref:DUF6226 family protein n=1 Tax=Nocardioides sp. TaxID=35761 RepID=UPI002BD6C9B2|nr:DUF6226 family protein [Nocardioides sp.]HTW17709.1 DUF6226 family protein [Nocardioides sp.]